MRSANVVRFVVVAAMLHLMLAACSGGGAATVATSNNPSASNQPSAKSEVSQPAASGGALSAQGIDACKAITADDVKRISTYDGAKFEGKD